MSTIVTRVGKGSALTWEEADSNFTNLNTDKLEASDIADILETLDNKANTANPVFTGRVGVGTASPGINLQVGDTTNDTGTVGIRAATSGTGTPQISLLRSGQEEWFIRDTSGSLAFAANATERMRIDSSGNVLVTGAGGLGYGIGSGGTVTQATSKDTSVTLNKPCGQITMNSAVLADGASVSFILSNSLLANADILRVNVSQSDNYITSVVRVSAGGARIRLTNISGASRSEAVLLSFAIIKGATS